MEGLLGCVVGREGLVYLHLDKMPAAVHLNGGGGALGLEGEICR